MLRNSIVNDVGEMVVLVLGDVFESMHCFNWSFTRFTKHRIWRELCISVCIPDMTTSDQRRYWSSLYFDPYMPFSSVLISATSSALSLLEIFLFLEAWPVLPLLALAPLFCVPSGSLPTHMHQNVRRRPLRATDQASRRFYELLLFIVKVTNIKLQIPW